MMARMWWSGRCCGLLFLVALAARVSAITLDELDSMVLNNPDEFCLRSDCLGQYTAETCPQGTRWREGVARGGCCGACVRFMQEGESVCTGKVDPKPCHNRGGSCNTVYEGYGMCDTAGECEQKSVNAKRATRAADQAQEQGSVSPEEQHQQFLRSLTRVGETQVENVLQSSWCDFGMLCDSESCKLEPTWVTCINTQESFDRDANSNNFQAYRDDYRWRPTCTIEGNYGPKQCKGYIDDDTRACECVDPEGNTLPGKAFKFQESLYTDMNCLCSRRVYEREQAGETGLTLHCTENGNFEPMQCEEGWCYCVHPENGTVHGYQMPENALNLLPCYNRTLVGDLYLRKCDSTSHAYHQMTELMFSKGVKTAPAAVSTCNYDGSYAPRQCTGGSCSCVSELNADCLNDGTDGCQCTRDQLTYDAYGRSYAELDCVQLRGTYETDQELSSLDVLYRVDVEGNRVSSVVRVACQELLLDSVLDQCQKVGNIEDSNGYKYCEHACSASALERQIPCPSSVFFYSPDYVANSETCIV